VAIIVLAGGSSDRVDPAYLRAAREFGRRAALEGWTLRTGGGSGNCVMGAATDGALACGGRVEGVILKRFWRHRHRGLHSLKSSATFARRKAGLFEGARGAIVFPGGYGTLDELSDLLALKQNEFTNVPVVVLNTRGYYDAFLRWVARAAEEGFLYGPRLFRVAATPGAAIRQLQEGLRPPAPS
jgi:uncharacterized protein (TIGR00730 family)